MTGVEKLQKKVTANIRGMISAIMGLFLMAWLISSGARIDSAWLMAGELFLFGANLLLLGRFLYIAFFTVSEIASQSPAPRVSTEDRLDELERLKRRDMVTPEEYATKRHEILKDL